MTNNGLSKLTEELGELGQVVGKMLAYGTAPHPDGGPPLTQRFIEEAADVMAAITFVAGKHGLDFRLLEARMLKKIDQFVEWDADPKS